ncbi:MAG: methyltransferase domain-containing protein [Candidatus Margulisbacteria bacterium]|jgi:SAM-dependent methyltransferase|nr:methyltransferase domain-containing protein [Candidatus Margulisiibacteriota bacterium]
MKILNVGCGNQTYGTDFVDLYPQRPGVAKCDVDREKLPYADASFDEVYSDNMMEHLKNPNLVLSEMVRVLKKGGRLVIITDNASFWAYHLGAKTHYGGYEERLGQTEDRHYALYTAWHLTNHFRALGLQAIEREYLLIKHKHSSRLPVKLGSWLLRRLWPHLGSPQIKVTGVKT